MKRVNQPYMPSNIAALSYELQIATSGFINAIKLNISAGTVRNTFSDTILSNYCLINLHMLIFHSLGCTSNKSNRSTRRRIAGFFFLLPLEY